MKVDIKVPAMGESISEAIIGSLLKADGIHVKIDDELLELETDKVNQVLYASQTGIVTWKIKQGDHVKIGQILGSIESRNEPPKSENHENEKKASKEPTEKAHAIESPQTSTSPSSAPPSQPASNARKTKEQFIEDLNSLPPSTENKFQKTPEITHKTVAEPSSERHETRKTMSRVRKVIATRLVDVLQQTAMLTTFNEVDMTKIISLRDAYKEAFFKQYQVKLGFMSFFVKAAVSAMKAFPEINAYIDGDDIVYRHYYDIGIAVGTDLGLFVPVVRNCDSASFAAIEKSIESYATQAREGRLAPNDLQGAGFTITNGGTYGSLLSTPILNPPQSAILGMHKIAKRPIVVNDQIVIREMMYLALSYDHRIVDGKEAVSFLVHIKNALEDPSRILIGI